MGSSSAPAENGVHLPHLQLEASFPNCFLQHHLGTLHVLPRPAFFPRFSQGDVSMVTPLPPPRSIAASPTPATSLPPRHAGELLVLHGHSCARFMACNSIAPGFCLTAERLHRLSSPRRRLRPPETSPPVPMGAQGLGDPILVLSPRRRGRSRRRHARQDHGHERPCCPNMDNYCSE